ncbi:MAG: hypothetical protein LH645_11670 [Actinomycetia bacterium]|nr:hypothetical protein [Actinomycetes bacterium]
MSDIEQLVKEALRARAADIPDGSSPSIPIDSSTTHREGNRNRWVLASVVAAAAVVLGFALIDGFFPGLDPANNNPSMVSIDTSTPPPSCGTKKGHDDGPPPTFEQLTTLGVRAASVCQWTNEEPRWKPHVAISTYYENYTLTNEIALSQVQATDLMVELASADEGPPECAMDSAPSTVFSLLLGDTTGKTWPIDLPQPACLGFALGDKRHYTSPGVNDLLISYSTRSFPLPSSSWQPGDSAEQALLTGILRLDGQCLVAGPPAHPTAVVWPADFSATIDGSGQAQVRNIDGAVVATTGEQITAGGGAGPTNFAPWKHMTCVSNYRNVFVIQDSMTSPSQ